MEIKTWQERLDADPEKRDKERRDAMTMEGSIFRASGYSQWQFNPEQLREKAKLLAKHLPELMKELDADSVIVTGKSGMSLAFAALMLIDFNLVVVRKDGESSHGRSIESNPTHKVKKYLILDDFVSSGNTIHKIISAIDGEVKKECFSLGHHLEDVVGLPERPICVGILEYDSDSSHTFLKYKGRVDIKHDPENKFFSYRLRKIEELGMPRFFQGIPQD